MTRRDTLLIVATGALAGCAKKTEGKTYAMDGEIKALDPSTKSATIRHGKIGDWMEAMTMEYRLKPDSEYQKLKVGDKIHATLVVNSDDSYYVTDVTVTN